MSDTFPVSLSGPACSSGAMPAPVTGAAATVATTMPTTVTISVATAVATAVSAAVATAVATAVSTTIPAAAAAAATATATATAFGVGDVVSDDEAALAEFHGLGHPGPHDCDHQGRPGQPPHERTPRSGPVTRRFEFDLHGCFSWGVAASF
jgi:hypothetical protein